MAISCRKSKTNHHSRRVGDLLWIAHARPLVENMRDLVVRRVAANPVLGARAESTFSCPACNCTTHWESRFVYNPAAVLHRGAVHLLYRAQDARLTSRIGLAVASDGVHFERRSPAEPVFYPDASASSRRLEWDGGIEDPRVVERAPADGGGFLMTYTAWNKMVARLCIATSPNLLAWSRHGPAFAGTAYEDAWSKSGAIVARAAAGGRVIAERVQGRFWMYWGEHHVHLATSPDLIRWTPLLDAAAPLGEGYRGAPYNRPTPGLATPLRVLSPRATLFDSALCEHGCTR